MTTWKIGHDCEEAENMLRSGHDICEACGGIADDCWHIGNADHSDDKEITICQECIEECEFDADIDFSDIDQVGQDDYERLGDWVKDKNTDRYVKENPCHEELIKSWMKKHDAQIISTGGGCEAIAPISQGDESHWMITGDDGGKKPDTMDEQVTIGYYTEEHQQMFCMTVEGGLKNISYIDDMNAPRKQPAPTLDEVFADVNNLYNDFDNAELTPEEAEKKLQEYILRTAEAIEANK